MLLMKCCNKCLTKEDHFVSYRYFVVGEGWKEIDLCHFCNNIFDQPLIIEFIKDDYGNFPISEISKNMIEARKKRSLGTSPWKSSELSQQ